MNPGRREDTHNPRVVGSAIAALLTVLIALVTLVFTLRLRRNRRAPDEPAV